MKVEDIAAHEADFDARGIDSSGKRFTLEENSIPIPGEPGSMDYVRIKPVSGNESYYYRENFDKEQIVLHYTVGYLKSDIATLTKYNQHVSVPFIIGRNGKIYNLFYSGFWSYHLGPGAVGGNETRSKRTIGVEISNIGGLNFTKDGLTTYYRTLYCKMDQQESYVHENFRRFSYYATFTDAQYNSLIILLRYLTARYGISRRFLPKGKRYVTSDYVKDFEGIVSHVNYRDSGKEDVGPAYDWERIIQGVSA